MRFSAGIATLALISLILSGCETNPFAPSTYFGKRAAPAAAKGAPGGAAGPALPGGFNPAAMQIVASVRHYYATSQRSYYHLLLYSGDGALVRPLTRLEGVNDLNPVFSPDGKQVCFLRKKIDPKVNAREGYALIADLENPAEEQALEGAPSWYKPKNEDVEGQEVFVPNEGRGLEKNEPFAQRFTSPEGRFEIVIHYNYREDKGKSDGGGGFAGDVTFRLRDRQTSATERMALMKGFQRLSHAWLIHQTPYFYEGPLQLAFFCCHIDSTDGTAFYALDLNRKAFTPLSPNGGLVVPIRGVPGFFFVSEERYQDLGDGKTRVNCKYLDFYGATLQRTRYAPPISVLGGAAVYVPGHGATVIP